jgi:hypothetical protein
VAVTRFVVDAGAVLQLASEEFEVSGKHKLLAPTLLRSQHAPPDPFQHCRASVLANVT